MNTMRKVAIIGFFTFSIMLCFAAPSISANANGIVIDGNYNDWEGQYQKVQANSDASVMLGFGRIKIIFIFIWIQHQILSITTRVKITERTWIPILSSKPVASRMLLVQGEGL